MICTPNTGHPVLGVHIIKLLEISDYYSSVTSGRPAKTYRGDFDFYSSVTSGRPAKLLRTDSTPASKEAESTTLQSTEESTADVPMVATAV